MRDSKRNMLHTVLNTTFGGNAPMIREAIKTGKVPPHLAGDAERIKFNAATVVSSRCASFQQALKVVEGWAND